MNRNCYIEFYPNTKIDFIKMSSNTSLSLTEASAARDVVDTSLILKTKYADKTVDALYFSQEENDEYETSLCLYRREPGETTYKYICTVLPGTNYTKDYNIKGDSYYQYLAVVENRVHNVRANRYVSTYTYFKYFVPATGDRYVYNSALTLSKTLGDNIVMEELYPGEGIYLALNNSVMMVPGEVTVEEYYYHTYFDSWTICNIEPSSEDGVYYKDGKLWNLGLNLNTESIQNNQSVTSWDTLGKYARISRGNVNYDGMQFTGLLGKMIEYDLYEMKGMSSKYLVDTKSVDRYTEKMEDTKVSCYDQDGNEIKVASIKNPYARENDKLEAWREFISDGALKLIRDRRGNSWIGQISDSSSYEINHNITTISFSWKEVMDIDSISIIDNE